MSNEKTGYLETFNRRGELYHRAMKEYPDVRVEEFKSVVDNVKFNDGDIICDIPSGGGYLEPYISKKCDIISIDFSHGFVNSEKLIHHPFLISSPNHIPLKNNSIDTAISIAGVHHNENQQHFYSNVYSILKEDGNFILSDVFINSNVAYFLDSVVGKYNSTGHDGLYLTDKTHQQLIDSGFVIEQHAHKKFSWTFNSEKDISKFMLLFFDMKNIKQDKLLNIIDDTLGIYLKDGRYYVRWSLMTYYCNKSL